MIDRNFGSGNLRWSLIAVLAVLLCLVLAEAASTNKEPLQKDSATSNAQKDSEVNPMCVKPPPVPNAFLSLTTPSSSQQRDLPNGSKITFFSVGDSVTYECLPGYVVGRGQATSPVLRVKCTESKDGTPVWDVRGRCNPIPPGGPAVQDLFYPHERRKVQSDAGPEGDQTSVQPVTKDTQLQEDASFDEENDRGRKSRRYTKRPGFYSGQSAKRFASGRLNEPDEEIAAIEELPIEIAIKALDCTKDGTCKPKPLPDINEGRIVRKLKIAQKFHNPFHQYGGLELSKQHITKHHPANLLYEPPDLPRRYTGSRWARHHPLLPPPVCDGPACDIGSSGEQLALSVARPDFETKYPDSTEDVMTAAFAGGAVYRGQPREYEFHVGEVGPDHQFAQYGFRAGDCYGPKCPNKPKKVEKELPDKYKKGVAKPYSEEEVTQRYTPEPVEPYCGKEEPCQYRPVPQPPGPPCNPNCRDGKNCCGYTKEGEPQGQYNPEFEELTAKEGPYYPSNYKADADTANDDDDDDECDKWLDWFLEPRNVLKMVTGALAIGFAIHLLRCLLCQATPEEGSLEHDSSGANCSGAWNLLGDKSCAAAAVDDDSDDGCPSDKCGPC